MLLSMLSFHQFLGWMPEQYSQYTDYLMGYTTRVSVPHFSFSKLFRPAVGTTQPPIQLAPGALFLWVQWPGCEAHYSSPPHAFMA